MISWFKKTYKGLEKTRLKLTSLISGFTGKSVLSADDLLQLEEVMLQSDLGWEIVENIIEKLKKPDDKSRSWEDRIYNYLHSDLSKLEFNQKFCRVIFLVGVNGTGKTTTAAKLAGRFSQAGEKVMLVGADTYRAAAVEQIEFWSKQLGVKLVSNLNSNDPAAVVFDGIQSGLAQNYDRIIVDTAGRIHTSKNLMKELEKVFRVGMKQIDACDAFITIDANTGQNGLNQARLFSSQIPISGAVLTKMDGTARGGIAVAIMKELKLPVQYIGVGEKINDLIPFDLENYLHGLIGKEKAEMV